jgi:putative peptidoglycan lipid II flippase
MIRSAGIVSGWTLISRVLGLARDVLMAGAFGTTATMSAFVVAFTIPNLFRRLFGEGALSSAFVPVFVETRRREGDEAAWGLARRVAVLTGGLLTLLTVAGIAAATAALRAGVDTPRLALILSLGRIMLPYMIFICLAALCMAILNSLRHFAVPAAAPSLLNVVWIAALIAAEPRLRDDPGALAHAVAAAVLVAGALQLAVQLPVLARKGLRPGPLRPLLTARVLRVARLMGPAALGLAVTQINVLVDRLLAAWIGPWAPAALFYSERLVYLPLGLFATALGTVLLPEFSAQAAERNDARVRATVQRSLRLLLFVMIPAAVGLAALAPSIISAIFQWRVFDAQSTDTTALALRCYAPGLVVFSLAKVFVPVFYGHQDTQTPVKLSLIAMAVNLGLNLLFIAILPLRWKHAGLALATVLAEGLYAGLLAVRLHRRFGSPGWRTVSAAAARMSAAAAGMGFAAVAMQRAVFSAAAGALPVKIAQTASVAAAIAAAVPLYLLLALILRAPELRDLRKSLFARPRGVRANGGRRPGAGGG